MEVPVNGKTATTEFESCDNSCRMPRTLKKATVKTPMPRSGECVASLDILRTMQRRVAEKMFDVD